MEGLQLGDLSRKKDVKHTGAVSVLRPGNFWRQMDEGEQWCCERIGAGGYLEAERRGTERSCERTEAEGSLEADGQGTLLQQMVL
jgi:acyl CoA:acetate/3-ketoacid CoA transferase alpha subunit